MKKYITKLVTLVAIALVLVACGGGGKAGLTTEANGRKYHAFALATSFTNSPGFDSYHSRELNEWGVNLSNNTVRFATDELDDIIDTMKYANPVDDLELFKKSYLRFVEVWNEEVPILPLYANDYHDLYNGNNLQNFTTGPLWTWRESIIDATSPNETVTIGVSSDWNGSFIPGWSNSAYDRDVQWLVFGGGLVVGDEGGKMTLNYMTEDLDISDDQKTWTFSLKKDIVWSDGEPFTADDVIHTYLLYAHPGMVEAGAGVNRAMLPVTYPGWDDFEAQILADDYDPEAVDEEGNKLPPVWDDAKIPAALESFDGFKKIDDYTVQFNFNVVEFNTWSSIEAQPILPRHYYSPDGLNPVDVYNKLLSKPLGSGPYVLTDYVEGQHVKFERNDHYPGNIHGNKPGIEYITYKRTADETDVDELLAGSIDLLAGQIQGNKIEPVYAEADNGYAWSNYKRHGYGHLSFHTDFGPMAHKEVRQAFAYSMDREEFIEEFTGGYAVTVQGPYSLAFVMDEADYDPLTPWHISQKWVDDTLINYQRDYDKANELLTAGGWVRGKDGLYAKEVDGKEVKTVIGIAAGSQDWADALNLSTRDMEKEVGIKVIVEPIDFNILLHHYYGQKEAAN